MVSSVAAFACPGDEPRALTSEPTLTAAHREAITARSSTPAASKSVRRCARVTGPASARSPRVATGHAHTRRWLDAPSGGIVPGGGAGSPTRDRGHVGYPRSGGHARNWRRTGRACRYSRHPFAFKRQTGCLPISQPTGVSTDMSVAAVHECVVERDAGVAVNAGAVHHDVILRAQRGEELICGVEVFRPRDVFGSERPFVQGHHQPERVATPDHLQEFVPVDGSHSS